MNELNLNKGDRCFVATGNTVVEAVIAVKRVSKNGVITYFIDISGVRCGISFNEYGHQNYKNWREAAMSRRSAILVKTKREAVRIVAANAA